VKNPVSKFAFHVRNLRRYAADAASPTAPPRSSFGGYSFCKGGSSAKKTHHLYLCKAPPGPPPPPPAGPFPGGCIGMTRLGSLKDLESWKVGEAQWPPQPRPQEGSVCTAWVCTAWIPPGGGTSVVLNDGGVKKSTRRGGSAQVELG
jgi:hypothetical protein